MAIELVCDNCGQRKAIKRSDDQRGWRWISSYGDGGTMYVPVECPDCIKAVADAQERATKEALAIRAVKGSRWMSACVSLLRLASGGRGRR